MNREELDKTLDEWLDRAAADYGKSELRPGFEARIIASLNSRLRKKTRRIPLITLSVAAAAILIFGIGALLIKFQSTGRPQIALKEPATIAPAIRESAPQSPPPRVIEKELAAEPSAARRIIPESKQTGRGRFLSSRLTDQERYLIAYARIVSTSSVGGVEESEFWPTEIPQPQVPPLYVPELRSLSVENKDLQISKLQNEEPL